MLCSSEVKREDKVCCLFPSDQGGGRGACEQTVNNAHTPNNTYNPVVGKKILSDAPDQLGFLHCTPYKFIYRDRIVADLSKTEMSNLHPSHQSAEA